MNLWQMVCYSVAGRGFCYVHVCVCVCVCVQVLRPMVKIARHVIEENGYSGVIRVVAKRSTEMTEGDMEGGRANILVTEVFDTELIGEGGLLTFVHAHKHLLEVSGTTICMLEPW